MNATGMTFVSRQGIINIPSMDSNDIENAVANFKTRYSNFNAKGITDGLKKKATEISSLSDRINTVKNLHDEMSDDVNIHFINVKPLQGNIRSAAITNDFDKIDDKIDDLNGPDF